VAEADINNITVSITNIKQRLFGPTDTTTAGFHFQNGPNLLFEGALLGTGTNQISNAEEAL
jgi:hypothetical protein